MGTCYACGAGVADHSRFCSACGRPTNSDDAATRTVAASVPISGSSSRTPGEARVSGDGRFLPGEVLASRYRIVALLGRGGMGEVYRADDLTLGQQVALKFLPESVAANPNIVERFRGEVRIARRVSHPNVCRVYDVGEIDGHLFLSMEYVDGEDLGSLLRRIGRLPQDKALEIARKLCAGLAAAHEKGVLHRDLKPGNVMLDGRGQAMLTDFGLAGFADQIQGAEVRNGTPAYMAPEQLAGTEVTPKSDLYSLGLVIYELLTGKRPFESAPRDTQVHPSTLVKDLDPRIERVIQRCLEPDPAKRPASALAVAAALPGGDPLAEALAAGETPSPEMVAAAGEGAGIAARIAIPALLAIVAGLIGQAVLARNLSALERMRLGYSPEILAEKGREMIQKFGYTDRPADEAFGFLFDSEFADFAEAHEKPRPRWGEILAGRPCVLLFRYRQSPYPLVATQFHDDRLTPGIVGGDDPAPELSGMVNLTLDAQGRLIEFRAIPPELQEPAQSIPPADWAPLFAAAEIDPSKLRPAEPQWTFLLASDTRAAWTGVWPGTDRPLSIEAAAMRGKPVAFSLRGPWTTPLRMPPRDAPLAGQAFLLILSALTFVILVGGALLAWRNIRQNKGDRRGAFRLAVTIFWVQMALWIFRAHFAVGLGTFGVFLLALCTSVFYAVVMWTIYVALEPFVRRHWPQALISWTGVLTGRGSDPIVGRDVLIGVAFGVFNLVLDRFTDVWGQAKGVMPNVGNLDYLVGFRGLMGVWVGDFSVAIRSTLFTFFQLFVLRALLRNRWLAGAAFVLIWSVVIFFQNTGTAVVIQTTEAVLFYSLVAVVVVRYGLLVLAVGTFVYDILDGLQMTFNPWAWYFGNGMVGLAAVTAIAIWAFYTSTGGQRLWNADRFG